MSYRRSRKRRRSQAFPVDDNGEEINIDVIKDAKDARQDEDNSGENGEDTNEESKKELEIWDAFREEHYEGSSMHGSRNPDDSNPIY